MATVRSTTVMPVSGPSRRSGSPMWRSPLTTCAHSIPRRAEWIGKRRGLPRSLPSDRRLRHHRRLPHRRPRVPRGLHAFGRDDLDAALLLLPTVDFVAYDDERMVRTTDAVREELDDGGLVRRYRSKDRLPGREGSFVACTFWLAECLAR